MNKKELVEKIAKEAGLTKADAKKTLESIINNVVSSLQKNSKITVTNLGTFSVVKKSARFAKNPKTGDLVKVKSKNVTKFIASVQFQENIGGGTDDTGPMRK